MCSSSHRKQTRLVTLTHARARSHTPPQAVPSRSSFAQRGRHTSHSLLLKTRWNKGYRPPGTKGCGNWGRVPGPRMWAPDQPRRMSSAPTSGYNTQGDHDSLEPLTNGLVRGLVFSWIHPDNVSASVRDKNLARERQRPPSFLPGTLQWLVQIYQPGLPSIPLGWAPGAVGLCLTFPLSLAKDRHINKLL